MKKINWIFDLDDTLRWTSWDYTWANMNAYVLLTEEFQHHTPHYLPLLHDDIDLALVLKKGLTPARYIASLEEVYRVICDRNGLTPKKTFIRRLRKCGKAIFDSERYAKHGLVEGAEETLEYLLQTGDSLTLVTRGIRSEQLKKVKACGLEKYFSPSEVIVVNETPPIKQPHFKRLLGNKDPSSFFSVGDSMDCDINAATELGMWGIHIPNKSGTWRYDEVNETEDERVLLTRKSIAQLACIDCSLLPCAQARKLATFINDFRKLDAAGNIEPGEKAYNQRIKGIAWFPERTIVFDRISDIKTKYSDILANLH